MVLTTHHEENLTFPYDGNGNLPLMFLDRKAPHVGLTGHVQHALNNSASVETTSTLLEKNHNLSKQGKELLLWHNRFGHCNMRLIRDLMRHDVIPVRTNDPHKCDTVGCPACQLSKQHRRTPKTARTHALKEHEMSIRKNDLKPGERVSIDQYTTRVKGRMMNSRGRGPSHLHYTGGTMFVDHASGHMFAHHQVSTRVGNASRLKGH